MPPKDPDAPPPLFPEDLKDATDLDLGKAERKAIDKRNHRRAQRDSDDMKKVLGSVEGRRILARILYKACVMNDNGDMIESSFNPNSMSMAFTEGSRRLGFVLMNDIKRADRNALSQIQRERESDLISEAKGKNEEA